MGQGNIIGKPNLPATTSAKGVWNLREQNTANRASLWPGYDPQWANTTLLLKTGPAQATTDTSSYSFYGTPTFSQSDVPYAGIGLGSVTIDTGTAQESVYVTGANMAIGNGNFTVEAWVRYTNFTGGVVATSRWAGNQSNIYWYLGVTTGGRPLFLTRSNSFYTDFGANSTTNVLSTGVWYHMAGVREGGVLKLYINGVLQNVTQSDGGVDLTEQSVSIGFFNYSGYTAGSNATISGFRLTKSAVYTANFTPPTTKPVALANNVLLLNFDGNSGTVTDATGKNALTSTATVANSPALFDGNALSLSGSTSVTTTATSGNTLSGNFAFGTGDFTIEAWIYPTSSSGDRCIFSTRGNQANAVYFGMYTNAYTLGYYTAGAWIVTSTVAAPANAWSHVALVRANGVAYLYLNGACVGSAANTTNLTESVGTIGRSTGDNAYGFIGSLEEVRVTKAARYTGAFTPPTTAFDRDWEPPYNDTLVNSNVLQVKSIDLPGATNNVFRDDSTNNLTPVRNGDVTQGSFSPYIPTGYWSAYFDGSGDWVSAPNAAANVTNQNYTAEAWVWFNVNNIGYQPIFGNTGTGDAHGWILITETNNFLYAYHSASGGGWNYNIATNYQPTTNTWTHLALVRNGTTITLYANGVSIGSTSIGTNSVQSPSGAFYAGYYPFFPGGARSLNGYISNLRLVVGTAVYTSNFTVPTAPLTAVANTSLLMLQDNRFIDRSANNRTLTRSGDVQVSRFDPFSLAVPVTTVATTNPGSVVFDGNGDYLTVPSNAAFTFPSDFTVEAWINPTSWSAGVQYTPIFRGGGGGSNFMLSKGYYNTNLEINLTGVGAVISVAAPPPLNAWSHVAVTRSGTTLSLFLNGTRVGTTTSSVTFNTDTMYVAAGAPGDGTSTFFPGSIASLRVVKGTAVYDATLTTLTVPTSPLTAISGTSLLTCQDSATITDASTNNFTITRVGDAKPIDASPFQTTKRATYAYGGSGYFDGSGDHLQIPTHAGLAFGTGDFCVEFWVNPTSYSSQIWFGSPGGSDRGGIAVGTRTTGGMWWLFGDGSSWIFERDPASTGLTLNAWNHVAVTRSGGTARLFCNGVVVDSLANSTNLGQGSYWQIGQYTTSYNLAGHIANFRVVKGNAVYTANFTPPTSPVTAISGTSLLLNFDNAGVYDAAGSQNLVTRGNTITGTTTRKNEVSATYFDGTANVGVYSPTLPVYGFGTGDFTIEFWVYRNDSTTAVFYDQRPGSTNGAYPTIYVEGNTLYYYVNSGNQINGGTLAATTWHHIAVSRSASQTRMFVNGSQVGSTFSDTVSYLASRPMIGSNGAWGDARLNGHIEGVRVSRVGRYTANFTPPSEPHPIA